MPTGVRASRRRDADGRPRVTPVVAVWADGAVCFATGHAGQGLRPCQDDPFGATRHRF